MKRIMTKKRAAEDSGPSKGRNFRGNNVAIAAAS
jgi:hypothetical protein